MTIVTTGKEDIGKEVLYTGAHNRPVILGRIKSISDKWVFVNYHSGDIAAATKREDLCWAPKDCTCGGW